MTTNKKLNKSNNKLLKPVTAKEAMDFVKEASHIDDDPEYIIKELTETFLPKLKSRKYDKKTEEKAVEVISKAVMMNGLDNHIPLAETVKERYRPFIIKVSRQLTKEYNCKTTSEKMLVEVIVGAYARIFEYSQLLHTCRKAEFLSNEKNGFYTMLSKELDRANRHYITALSTLKQIKQPALAVNVKAKAAFVAQNQQLNVNKDNQQDNENNTP